MTTARPQRATARLGSDSFKIIGVADAESRGTETTAASARCSVGFLWGAEMGVATRRSWTLMTLSTPTVRSAGLVPIKRNWSTCPGATRMEYRPSLPLIVPVVVPRMITDTLWSAMPCSSVIFPVTVFCCANAEGARRTVANNTLKTRIFIWRGTGFWWTLCLAPVARSYAGGLMMLPEIASLVPGRTTGRRWGRYCRVLAPPVLSIGRMASGAERSFPDAAGDDIGMDMSRVAQCYWRVTEGATLSVTGAPPAGRCGGTRTSPAAHHAPAPRRQTGRAGAPRCLRSS